MECVIDKLSTWNDYKYVVVLSNATDFTIEELFDYWTGDEEGGVSGKVFYLEITPYLFKQAEKYFGTGILK